MSTLHNALRAAVLDPTTENLKEAATQIVILRAVYHRHEGLPDWAGRSIDYRHAIERAYRNAGVPSDSEDGLQASLRYHVSNVLRSVAPPEELEKLGLSTSGARKRRQERRAQAPAPHDYWRARAEAAERKLADITKILEGADK